MTRLTATAPGFIASGWQIALARPRLAALILGLVAATGFPPLHLWPLTLLALAAFIALVRAAPSWRQAAWCGYLFGWAHLTLANNWIATAFTYQAEMPAFLGWIAVPLVCVYLAIYPALAALAAHRLARSGSTIAFTLALAGCWIVAEWLRSWVFTGYPWPPLGLALLGGFDAPGIARILPWMGTYALSGVAMLLAGALLALGMARRWPGFAAALAAIGIAMLWPAGPGEEGSLPYRLVQPNLRQSEINDPTRFEAQFANIARLTVRSGPSGQDPRRLILWPESAVPDYLEDGYPQRYYDHMTAAGDPQFARRRIGNVIGDGSLLLTGNVDLEIAGGKAVGAYNAVSAIDPGGEIRARYVKAHLVPYGEYLALRWLLEPLGATRLVAGAFDFIPGPGPRTLDLGAYGQAGIQICYEIVFSGQVVDRSARPDYIFNPSNDGWFGSWGPPQHLAQARLRAIEEGLPVLRSTTTGISAVIDARGVVRQSIGRGQADSRDGLVPPAHGATPFARLGNLLPLGWAMLALIASLVATRRTRV